MFPALLAAMRAVSVPAPALRVKQPGWYVRNGYEAFGHRFGGHFRLSVKDPKFIIDGDEFPPPETIRESLERKVRDAHPLDVVP